MKHQPDKLFKDKLENYSFKPSANAWKSIENNLDQEKRSKPRPVWLKIAATLLIMAVATGVIGLFYSQSHDETLVMKIPDSPKTQRDIASLPEKTKQDDHLQAKSLKESLTNSNATGVHPISIAKKIPPTLKTLVENQAASSYPTDRDSMIQVNQAPAVANGQAIKIVITAEEANSKYLIKSQSEEIAHATPDEKKPSKVHQFLSKASRLKNIDPLGQLQETKDEILAINFRNDNRHENNK